MIAFMLLGLFSFAGLAGENSLSISPDPKAFEGIKFVVVAPITFTNLEDVKLTPETLRASMQNQLRKGEIDVFSEERLQNGARSADKSREDVGRLVATIRRWETSGPMGTTMNSFSISLRFFQKARVQPSQREAWAITWFETKSVIVGTKRTKGIEDALEELLQSFILDFSKRSETR